MKSDKEIREMISRKIHEAEPTARVILFGSRARKDYHKGSDWDVLVLVNTPKVSDRQFKDLNYDIWVAGQDAGAEINSIIYTEEQWAKSAPTMFHHNVMEEGIEI